MHLLVLDFNQQKSCSNTHTIPNPNRNAYVRFRPGPVPRLSPNLNPKPESNPKPDLNRSSIRVHGRALVFVVHRRAWWTSTATRRSGLASKPRSGVVCRQPISRGYSVSKTRSCGPLLWVHSPSVETRGDMFAWTTTRAAFVRYECC